MATARCSAFMQGLGFGVVATSFAGLTAIYALRAGAESGSGVPAVDGLLDWVYANLGMSLPVFGLLLVLYVISLGKLRRALAAGAAVEEVAQTEQLVDIWTSLFFGVGVIFTAIGMRGALVQSLGDPDTTLQLGAYAVLERMVDGGILLALSTTIFGGIGGYLLRVVKALTVETELKRHYDRAAHAPGREMHQTLEAIEALLKQQIRHSSGREEGNHDQARVAFSEAQRSGQQ